MGERKKINLSAILKDKNDKAQGKTEINNKKAATKTTEEIKNISWTLNKNDLPIKINKDSILKSEKIEEIKKTPLVNTTDENIKEKEEKEVEKITNENKKRVKFNQDSLLKAKEKDKKKFKEKQDEQEEINKKTEKDKKEKQTEEQKEIFSNYKTDYKKEKVSIVQKIKKLKNLPKTNYKLVTWLIVITLWIVATLFYLNPKDFSLQNIKSSIFNILHEDKIDEKRNEIENEHNKLVEEQKWKKDTIKYSWFDFTIEYRSLDWVKEYKYKNIEYITLEEIYKVLDEEIKLKQKDIIKDALLERFK